MTNAVVLSLREPGTIDPKTVLTGPLTSIRRERLQPGRQVTLAAAGVEFTIFVLAGSGTVGTPSAGTPSAGVRLSYGVSVTVPLGTELTVEAADEGLDLFVAELEVEAVDPA